MWEDFKFAILFLSVNVLFLIMNWIKEKITGLEKELNETQVKLSKLRSNHVRESKR